MASLFSDFLTSLHVKHTEDYSDRRFDEMPFQSLFGLVNLLKEYGVGAIGVQVQSEARMEAVTKFNTPFLADTEDGFAIVLKVANGSVTYMTRQKIFTVPIDKIIGSWNGVALLAEADSSSIEPEYTRHHVGEIAKNVKLWILCALVILLGGYCLWQTGGYTDWAYWLLLILDCTGIWLSWMLVQKSLGIHSSTAEAVCSALEEGGCDEIARSEASSFMGIFKWSEVGLAYFSISALALLMFPGTLPVLSAINILCLPYTVWSITYQKFVAKVWCTLCVCVQATLWALFAVYLAGGWTREILPLNEGFIISFIVLGCCYIATLLGINRLDDALLKYFKTKSSDDGDS